jgi:hypothetical protein
MNVIPVDEPPSTAAKPKGFWQRLMTALDQHCVEQSKQAVPAVTLRRARREIDRCRRLMRETAAVPTEANLRRITHAPPRP